MTTASSQLLSLLARISFRLGQFTLSSGATSDYYIDCRTTTLHAEGGRLTGHSVLSLLEENDIQAEAVGGLTLGADPIVSNVATASAWRAISNPGAALVHGFIVRKAEKAHGAGRRIEGFCREGARVGFVFAWRQRAELRLHAVVVRAEGRRVHGNATRVVAGSTRGAGAMFQVNVLVSIETARIAS